MSVARTNVCSRARALAAFALVLLLSPALTQAQTRAPVALDWQGVRDEDVLRCGLSGLRAGTLERLVQEGHAVVESVDEHGIRVQVRSVFRSRAEPPRASSGAGLEVQVMRGTAQRRELLRIPSRCDATFVLDAISRISELVAEVEASSPAIEPVAADTSADAAESASAASAEAANSSLARTSTRVDRPLSLSLHASLKGSDPRTFLLAGAGLAVAYESAHGVRLGGRVEVTAGGRLGITLVEPSALLVAGWQPHRDGFGLTVEAGPVLSLGHSDRRTTTDVDAQLGAGLQFGWRRLLIQLLGYARPRRIEHRVDGELALDTHHFGLLLRVGAQLLGG